jgi:hypothetical protein
VKCTRCPDKRGLPHPSRATQPTPPVSSARWLGGLLPKTSPPKPRPGINRSRVERPKPRSDSDSPIPIRPHGLALARRRRRQRPGPRRRRGRGGAVRHAPGGAVPLPHGGGRARPVRPQVREDGAAPPRLRRQVCKPAPSRASLDPFWPPCKIRVFNFIMCW